MHVDSIQSLINCLLLVHWESSFHMNLEATDNHAIAQFILSL